MRITTLSWRNCEATDRQWDIFYSSLEPKVAHRPLQFPRYPLILRAVGKKHQLLYGFDLFWYYIEQGIDSFPAYILTENRSWCELARLVVNYHRQQRELYPIEVAKLLNLLIEHDTSLQQIIDELADHLGVDLNMRNLNAYLSLTALPPELVEFLIRKKAPLQVWMLTGKMHPGATPFLLQLIQKTKLSLSVFREIITHVYEIARRDDCRFSQVIDSLGVTATLAASQTPSQRLAQLRQQIRAARFPVLSAQQQRIKAQIDQLYIPTNLKVTTDPSLETRCIQLSAVIRETIEWRQLQEFFTRNEVADIQKLLDML